MAKRKLKLAKNYLQEYNTVAEAAQPDEDTAWIAELFDADETKKVIDAALKILRETADFDAKFDLVKRLDTDYVKVNERAKSAKKNLASADKSLKSEAKQIVLTVKLVTGFNN